MQEKIATHPLWTEPRTPRAGDWLIHPLTVKATAFRTQNQNEIILSNGLISRTFRLSPNGATVGFDNLMLGQTVIRGVKPEAFIILDGKEYPVGGLIGQVEYGYLLPVWIDGFTGDPNAFQLVDITFGKVQPWLEWKQVRHAANKVWPPQGARIDFYYIHKDFPGVEVIIHYELYDGIPILCKWLTINNSTQKSIELNRFTSEILAMVEIDAVPQGDLTKAGSQRQIHMESDYIFGAMSANISNITSIWSADKQYTSQVAYEGNSPMLLESKPPIGPGAIIEPGQHFDSYRTFELIFDSTDKERRGLAQRRMYRTLCPWSTENPIFMHVVTADPVMVKQVVDQCAEIGFEMVILSFGCGIDMEWEDDEFFEEFKEVFDYAHQKGIEIGTYSLFSSRSIDPKTDVIDPKTMEPNKHATFGHAPCLVSDWGNDYLRRLRQFIEKTGADFIEHDGPYPGDVCASTHHSGHRGLADSQWTQWKAQSEFYRWCRARGVFINAPDWYFFNGTNKTAMGYKEVNWSLPRERQVILGRQNIYDGTWEKQASMGWMFTPLSVYHPVGDWKQSTLEPLSTYINFYEKHLSQNFSAGVQSCYRGFKLYDSEQTKVVVTKWVQFYKQYREILDSDIIHLRRPDGKHIDGILHVNPLGNIKGLAVFHNPQTVAQRETIKISLYYTGLTDKASISEQGRTPVVYSIDRNYQISLEVNLPLESLTWFLVK